MTSEAENTDFAVELRDIVKRFPGVLANDRVTLGVRRREVHALLGENGAGKSTLMNVLYGLYQPDAGTISVGGLPARIRSPADSLRAGIGMVPQHSALISTLTVVENVVLGDSGSPWLHLGAAARAISEAAERYGWRIDPWATTGDLSPGDHQRIEILKAIHRQARILILDEPTSVLTPRQAEDLIATLRRFATEESVIFISHKLSEVLKVSDRITVMRDGRVAATVETVRTSKSELARLMVGRDVTLPAPRQAPASDETVLEVRDVSARGNTAHSTLRGVSFSVRAGEVFGIAGVDGNGQSELASIICGLRSDHAGEVILLGGPLATYLHHPDRGAVGHIPDDRRRQGLVLDFGIRENLVLRELASGPVVPRFASLGAKARNLFVRFGIRAAGIEQPVRYLSGGNQQRVVLARETGETPALLVAVQPTQGLDIAATRDVYEMIIRMREQKAAIVYISTELEEIFALSDRIGVMSSGRLAGIVDKNTADLEAIGLMMGGGHG